jgi:hypothetical protein
MRAKALVCERSVSSHARLPSYICVFDRNQDALISTELNGFATNGFSVLLLTNESPLVFQLAAVEQSCGRFRG